MGPLITKYEICTTWNMCGSSSCGSSGNEFYDANMVEKKRAPYFLIFITLILHFVFPCCFKRKRKKKSKVFCQILPVEYQGMKIFRLQQYLKWLYSGRFAQTILHATESHCIQCKESLGAQKTQERT